MKLKIFHLLICLSLVSCKTTPLFTNNDLNPLVSKGIAYPSKTKLIPVGYVNDFENIFTESEIYSLEKTISDYEKKTTKEIVIVTIYEITPYQDIKNFATDISNDWSVGKEINDNGLTIVISRNLRQMRISTGLGTENILTNEICKIIIDDIIIPEFKENRYYDGTVKALTEIIYKWN